MEAKKKNSNFIVYPVIFVLCLILFLFQISYAGNDVVYKEKRPGRALKISEQSDTEKAAETKKKKQKYVYNPMGKIDPFASFLKKSAFGRRGATRLAGRDAESQGEVGILNSEPETELEKIAISKLTLTAVIKGKTDVWAMVIDPKGMGYFLKKGTKIGTHSGVVDQIICEDNRTDFGVESVRKVVVKIPYRDRNKRIIYRSVELKISLVAS